MFWWDAEDVDDPEHQERRLSNRDVISHLTPWLLDQRRPLLIALGLVVLVTASRLAGPQILRRVVNLATVGGDQTLLLQLAGLFVLVAVGGFALDYILTVIVSRAGLEVITRLKERLFRHVLQLNVAFFHDYTPGRLLSRVESDTENLKQLFSSAAIRLVSSLLTFIGIVAVMLWEDWRTTGLIIVVLPLIGGLTVFAVRILRKNFRLGRKASAKISSFLTEVLPAIPIIQHFGWDDEAAGKLEALDRELVSVNARASFISYGFWGVFHFFEVLACVALIAIATPRVLAGTLDLGTLIMFLEYLRQVFAPLIELSEFVNFIQRALVSAERVFSLLGMEPDDEEFAEVRTRSIAESERLPAYETREQSPRRAPPFRFETALAFEDVRFGYKPGEDVLHGISIHIPRGSTVALVGPSGGGKSTIANLLMHFYTPREGRLTVDGVDLCAWPRSTWREHIGLVLQELMLFPGTVRENLTVFAPAADDDKLRRALRIAEAERLVERLGGLDASLAERGRNLSHGERQLLSFARALVHDPPILVLDEATASVDPITERLIQRSLDRVLAGRTALIIAHRLSTIVRADQILVIEQGRVQQRGSHDSLVAVEGPYRRLYDLQFGDAEGSAA